jgi:putative transposase
MMVIVHSVSSVAVASQHQLPSSWPNGQQPIETSHLAPEETRFTKPAREHATSNSQTYFVTSATWERRPLFHNPGWAELFLEVLHSYRGRAYLLHEYVLMPEHFHVIITPLTSLERAVQFVKGGFSFRAKKDLKSSMEVWQRGFSDHRIRDAEDYLSHLEYIRRNPVGRKLVEHALDYPYCSQFLGCEKDEVPQWLKPELV